MGSGSMTRAPSSVSLEAPAPLPSCPVVSARRDETRPQMAENIQPAAGVEEWWEVVWPQ